MQKIIVEKPYRFIPPHRGNLLPSMIQKLRLTDLYLARHEGVESYEVRDVELLKESLRNRAGVLLAPNHCRYADPLAMGWVARAIGVHVFAMASWHLFNQTSLQAFAIRAMGAFSVYREGLDRQSLDTAVDCLVNAVRPLIVFPEGAVFRTNDLLQPLLEGVAFLARTAARKRQKHDGGQVVIHPVAIKYLYRQNVRRAVEPVLAEIEHRLTWSRRSAGDLLERINKITLALLSLKEIEYLGSSQEGSVSQRQSRLVDHLLGPLEQKWLGCPQQERLIPRIKQLRMKIVPNLTQPSITPQQRDEYWRDLTAIYLAQQVASYPPTYLNPPTTVTRILETVERLEEDLTDRTRVHRGLHAVIQIGPAVTVPADKAPRDQEDPIMATLRTQLQNMLDKLAGEAEPFV
ncbi:MAG: 1-acyl-sn-glycerol-3-phosphate acyltransferase [Pirellulaceae bacterium]|nr:1-acyl-sn-glycerol-3-phosphate acyltransferase [Pirellulaceae bacterium]